MIIANEKDRQEAIRLIQSWKLEKPMVLTAKPYKKDRSTAQNNICNVWYRDIAKQTGNDESYERCTMKLIFGVPILCRRHDFAEFWQVYALLPYESQLEAMLHVDVTAKMDIEEMTEYLYAVENHAYSQGLDLTKPKLYADAMGR